MGIFKFVKLVVANIFYKVIGISSSSVFYEILEKYNPMIDSYSLW